MKALSLMQPWAWLMVNGFKDIENRRWPTKFRGPVLVHASKTWDKENFPLSALLKERYYRPPLVPKAVAEAMPGDYTEFPTGGIVGIFTVTDCVQQSENPWFFGPFGFVVEDARPVPFIEMRGQLNFFEVPVDILETMFGWKQETSREPGHFFCHICGSQNGQFSGMKAHIRNVHGSAGG